MQILNHRQQLLFSNPQGGDHLNVAPKPGIQTVPDWVRDTPTWMAAVKAGIVVELTVVPAPALEPVVEEVSEATMVQDVDLEPTAAAPARRKGAK